MQKVCLPLFGALIFVTAKCEFHQKMWTSPLPAKPGARQGRMFRALPWLCSIYAKLLTRKYSTLSCHTVFVKKQRYFCCVNEVIIAVFLQMKRERPTMFWYTTDQFNFTIEKCIKKKSCKSGWFDTLEKYWLYFQLLVLAFPVTDFFPPPHQSWDQTRIRFL